MMHQPAAGGGVFDLATMYVACGLSVVPIKTDGSKRPPVAWKPYQEHLPTAQELAGWFNRPDPPGIAVISGAVSGNAEVIDFDCDAELIFPAWRELVEAEVWGLVAQLCIIRTPRGGYHARYRCSAVLIPGSMKLASDHAAQNACLIETRGEGAYAIVPGSPPACHHSGQAWEHVGGPPLTSLADLSAAEREVLIRCARSFDRPAPPAPEVPLGNGRHGVLPGEDYDRNGDDWAAILQAHGWTLAREDQGVRYWRRPGKSGPTWSATTGKCSGKDGADLLRVFSTNAHPFEDGKCYGRFRAYALLEYQGDFKAAAQALAGRGFGDQPRPQTPATPGPAPLPPAEPWPEPVLLTAQEVTPPFPTASLPAWLADWCLATAEATQTPADLPAMLALATCGAGLARKLEVSVRDGWLEPLNLFCVVMLPPGERKSVVLRMALDPVFELEAFEQETAQGQIAEAASEHRQMEGKLKALEGKIARADPDDAKGLQEEARALAREVARHKVPPAPQLVCDDVTPEALSRLLAEQGGRMLLASAEGTTFEISKGRYAEGGTANFDVYLKGHAGDPLRVNRVGREADIVAHPALSVALAVQPDVIKGLATQSTMLHRGFLARFLYAAPASLVGRRKVATTPVPQGICRAYRVNVKALWDLKTSACPLRFSQGANAVMQAFERWLEPQLAEGEELSYLAGWGNKLAGACARLAATLHMAEQIDATCPILDAPIQAATAEGALALGRAYLLPHAQATFTLMAADERIEQATRVWRAIRRICERSESSEPKAPRLSRRDIHQAVRTRQHFHHAEDVDPPIQVLVGRCYLRPVVQNPPPGKGRPASPEFEVNPVALKVDSGRIAP